VGGFWRYTLGVISVSAYTVLPGRIFGSDHYNPYTHTINIYSDLKAITIHEAAHAKDFAPRKYKGWYSFSRLFPLVPLYQEGIATGDAIGYYREEGLTQEEKDAYNVLYPAYGTYISGEGLRLASLFTGIPLWIGYAATTGTVISLHIIGRAKSAMVDQAENIAGKSLNVYTLKKNGSDLTRVAFQTRE